VNFGNFFATAAERKKPRLRKVINILQK